MLINGQLVSHSEMFDVVNPATGKMFAQAPNATSGHVESAIKAAREGFKSWSSLSRENRSQALYHAASVIEANRTDLELLLSREQGKPLPSAAAETSTAISMFRQAAHIAGNGLPIKHVKETPTHLLQVHHLPIGVVVGITPWNYPISLGCGKISRAISHGNSIILKPSPFTPLTSLFLGELLKDVFPAGVLNVVTGDEVSGKISVGQQLVESTEINLVSFTGSVATGKRIMAACAQNMTRVLLELGGNDPAIVLPDADIQHAAKGIYQMAMSNSGQICCAIKRVYVHETVYAPFVDELVRLAKEAVSTIGPGTTDGVKMGPLNNGPQLKRVMDLVADAVTNGGKIEVGGKTPPHLTNSGGFFYEPTIITGVSDGVKLVDEEQFGPVLPVIPWEDESDVIARANNSPYGLGASVWGRDTESMNRMLHQLEAGIVWANEHAVLREGAPFGGMKQSGFRREGDFAECDLDGYTEVQTVKLAK